MPDLLVTYPGGSTLEHTTVVAVAPVADRTLFAVARTPCHPESPRWPDQPADRCTLEGAGRSFAIECFEGYLSDERLQIGPPEPTAEALRCVVHRGPADLPVAVGTAVTLRVDEGYRQALSRSHSLCHLVSLALNAALADAWRKDPGASDSLGNPDFDKLAIRSSVIGEDGSLDTYRVGKHLRKAGFSAAALDDPAALAQRVEQIAGAWLASRPRVSVTPGVSALDERRVWSCELAQGVASFPCGGTHVERL
ncbi:MAG TPA: hypothetical protein VID29_08100, partial [Solirubrobacteraceae bacterium]